MASGERPGNQERGDVFPLLLGMEWISDRTGGLNRYFADLVRALQEDGGPDSPAVVLGPADSSPSEVFAVSHHAASTRQRLLEFGRKSEQLAAAADVVDGHFALYTAAALAFRRVRNRPLVVHFHGPWAAESEAQSSNRLAVAAKRWLERRVYRRADAIIVLSRAFGELVVKDYGVSPWRIHVIPPAVDLSRFKPGDRAVARDRLDLPADAFIVATARRLVPRMGIDVLIEAFSRLTDATDLLVIAGEGPERGELEDSVGRHGLEDRVRFLGYVDDDELVELYRAADVVAVPSTALEGFGLVVLEALACGTPVIATSVGGLPDAMEGLDPELIVAPADPEPLANRLLRVKDGAFPLPESCRRHAEAFDFPALARRHRAVYRSVVEPRDKLRVAYLTHSAQPSGAELALVRMLKALEHDVQPHVILGEEGPLTDELRSAGIAHEVLPMGSASEMRRQGVGMFNAEQARAALGTSRYVVELARRLRELRPDLVHTNSLKAALYGGVAARIARVPVIWHVHDRISPDYLPDAAVRVVRGLAKQVPDGIIANSAATLDTLPVSRGPRHIVGNAVEAARCNGLRTDPPFTVGVVGRLAPWKGQATLLKAFAEAFPTGDSRCRLIGGALFGEDDYETELRSLASRLGIDDRVEFRGHRRDVQSEYLALDVVVHSSILPEPFGQVIVEAQAASRPVIAAAAGGVLELVDDDETGLLYPPDDVESLAARLRRLAEEPHTRARLAANGARAAQRFAPPQIAGQMLAAYHDVLEGGRQ